MATSSITDRIIVDNADLFVEEYAKAMEARANAPFKPRTEDQKSGCITDPEEIRRFAEKFLEKKRNKHSG